MVPRTLLSLLFLSLWVVGALASRTAGRSREDSCGERGVEYVSVAGVLVPFYLGLASLGASVATHVYWVLGRLLFVSRAPEGEGVFR
ncbi:envelope glycoprotein N [Macacine alphaherpesvirus 1]|uniref:Envelope glycoprotein N n=1 Tax=Macacine alphaherpesvirus 2 TaxID=2845554 RepID=A0A1X9WF47_9ALPH|nr:envelope glycoprotein N [Macacine alphaherpesvirus 1]ARS01687.1 envelope glycoprotein N [Macacine alphaherpesvirus 2]